MKVFLMKAGREGPFYLVLHYTSVEAADLLKEEQGYGIDYSCQGESESACASLATRASILGILTLDGIPRHAQKIELAPIPRDASD